MERTLAGASGRGFRARSNAAGEIMRKETHGLSNRAGKYRYNIVDRPRRSGPAIAYLKYHMRHRLDAPHG